MVLQCKAWPLSVLILKSMPRGKRKIKRVKKMMFYNQFQRLAGTFSMTEMRKDTRECIVLGIKYLISKNMLQCYRFLQLFFYLHDQR